METKDTLSSCSDSEEQDMQQMLKRAKILKGSCLNGLSALKSNFTWKHVQGITKSEFERAFSRIFGEDVDTFIRMFSRNVDTLEQQLTKETILESNCQNAFRVLNIQFEKIFTFVLIKPSSLDVQEVKASDASSEDKAQESCMVSFLLLHSHLKLLSNNDLKGTRTEYGFKRAFTTLFGQDLETFTEYTQLEILEFCDTLIQHMEYVKKSIDKRALHKRDYDSRVNERQMQTTEEKVDTSKALDVNIRPIYEEEPMAEVQTTAKINVFATRQQHTEQLEFNNEGEVDQNAEQCHDSRPLPAKLIDNQITELSYQSLEIKRLLDDLRVTAAQVRVTAAKYKLVLLVILMKNMLSINAVGTKVTTASVQS
ncbi:hypothetical protein Tco_0977074 [Tanacetum coccineum]|uniref:Uncharacterized protein n=1 Tax=Tanacetum coccineum TaxID=301880 RepID=A0ABQ5EJK0_9ASTR